MIRDIKGFFALRASSTSAYASLWANNQPNNAITFVSGNGNTHGIDSSSYDSYGHFEFIASRTVPAGTHNAGPGVSFSIVISY
jgi:hypothetical protein